MNLFLKHPCPAFRKGGGTGVKKLLFIMKFTAIFIFIASLHVSASGYTQQVTLSEKNAKLEKVFKSIKAQTGYVFFYDQALLESSNPVTIKVKDAPLEEALKLCFSNQPFTYQIIDRTVVLRQKEKAITDNSSPTTPPINVHGRVLNESSEPVEGVSVKIKGTDRGTSTNANGEFSLSNVDDNAILVFTGVNIESFEEKVSGRTDLFVSAKIKVSNLQEVVVNKGYYNVKERENTGNTFVIKGTDIQNLPISNPIGAMAGRVPGLQITQTSGVPGTAFTVRLRGQNSVGSGNDPLYIVDGVFYNSTSLLTGTNIVPPTGVVSSPFNSLSLSDIESITILKDADATAIYGSRGANGVIIIKTKRSNSGKTKIDLNVYRGWGKVNNMIEMMNTTQYLKMRHEAFKNDGVLNLPPNAYDLNGKWDTTRFTDWQKLLVGNTAKILNAQIAITSGNYYNSFLLNGAFHKESTVFPGEFSDRKGSANFNFTHRSGNDKFKASFSSFYSSDVNSVPQSDLTFLITLPPDAPAIFDSLGKLNWQNSTWTNPWSNLIKKSKAVTDNSLTSLNLSYDLLKGLQLQSNFGYNVIELNQVIITPKSSFDPANINALASSNFINNRIRSWNIEPQLNYSHVYRKMEFNLIAGTTFLQQTQNILAQTGTGYTNDALIENLQAASTIRVNSFQNVKYSYNAFYGRLGFNYSKKYFINVTGRRDGSSRFAPEKRFSNFGAIGGGWIFSEEKLFKNKSHFFSFGKIRFSYGITGNDQISDYQYLDIYGPSGGTYQNVSALRPLQLYNPTYAWEKNKKSEIGLNIGLLRDRIFLSASYYQNRSSNQLLNYALPNFTGFSFVIENLPAIVENKGLEFTADFSIIEKKSISWTSNFNLSLPRNKLLAYPNIEGSSYANQFVVGQSLFISKRFHYKEINPNSGNYEFEDYDKDSQITFPNDANSIVFTGQQYYGGINNSLQIHNFQVDLFVQFVRQKNGNYSFSGMPGTLFNQPVDILGNHWQSSGDVVNVQKFSNANGQSSLAFSNMRFSDLSYRDASFVRLKTFSLSYNIPSSWNKAAYLNSSKVFFEGQNLLTITKYPGVDPETKGLLAPLRTFAIGFKITF